MLRNVRSPGVLRDAADAAKWRILNHPRIRWRKNINHEVEIHLQYTNTMRTRADTEVSRAPTLGEAITRASYNERVKRLLFRGNPW